ncbi:MAG TPA: hypothetical protein VF741_07920 [Candidatus Aquilonibacter sp.]
MRAISVLVIIGAAFAGIFLLVLAADAVLAFARPPQPLPLGTIQWLGEGGFTVDAVYRTRALRAGGRTITATGEFYIVHARVVAPFGLRPHWSDSYVLVQTFSGVGGSMRDRSFTVDETAQRLLDRLTGRPGPEHVVLGAAQHEDLVFDLPRNVEQPGLVFLPANSPMGLVGLLFGEFWQPHRFNLRYD